MSVSSCTPNPAAYAQLLRGFQQSGGMTAENGPSPQQGAPAALATSAPTGGAVSPAAPVTFSPAAGKVLDIMV
ncbi:hypothetical protein GC177_01695 [bacterium]|nr:hypothetical protein [bacterium]